MRSSHSLARFRRLRVRGVGEHHAVEDAGILERDGLADHAAHREADSSAAFRSSDRLSSPSRSSASMSSVYGPFGAALCAVAARVVERGCGSFVLERARPRRSHMRTLHASEWLNTSQGAPSVAMDFVVDLDAVDVRFHVFSTDQGNHHLVGGRAAVVADVQVARLARGPVLHRVAPVHDQRDVADALGEARMRVARSEPAFVHKLRGSASLRRARRASRAPSRRTRRCRARGSRPRGARRTAESAASRRVTAAARARSSGEHVDEAVVRGCDYRPFRVPDSRRAALRTRRRCARARARPRALSEP